MIRKLVLSVSLLFAAVLIGGALAEFGARIALPGWQAFSSDHFMVETAVPGHGKVFVGRAGFDGRFTDNNGDFDTAVRINGHGLRSGEAVERADGRIWVVGDSFTFGWGVEEDDRFSNVLEKDGRTPVYNIASPGSDVCGYGALIARMPKNTQPRAVIIGLTMENDVLDYDCAARAVAQPQGNKPQTAMSFDHTKRWFLQNSALYNLVAVATKRSALLRRVLTALGLVAQPHAYLRHFDEDTIPRLTDKTRDELVALKRTLPSNVALATLIIPARFDIRDNDPVYGTLRRTLTAKLLAAGIDVIDPTDTFRQAGFAPTHFPHDGHWTAKGHALAAAALRPWTEGVTP